MDSEGSWRAAAEGNHSSDTLNNFASTERLVGSQAEPLNDDKEAAGKPPLLEAAAFEYRIDDVSTPKSTLSTVTSSAVSAYAGSFVDLLRALLGHGFSTADRELRNDVILAIATFAEHTIHRAAFHRAGFTELAAVVATTPDIREPGKNIPHAHVV